MKSTILVGTLAITAIGLAMPAMAQQEPAPITQYSIRTVPEAFDFATESNSGNYHSNNLSILRQVDYVLGLGGFTGSFREKEIILDGSLVHEVYRDVMNQQVNSGPVIRTRDLVNPFNSTLSD